MTCGGSPIVKAGVAITGLREEVVLVEDSGHVESVPFEASEGEGELLSGPGHGVFKERAEGVGQLVGVLGQ